MRSLKRWRIDYIAPTAASNEQKILAGGVLTADLDGLINDRVLR